MGCDYTGCGAGRVPGPPLAGIAEILQLRERARQALGVRFEIRAFHAQVLGEH
ncbi:MAG: hypothetical protein JWQ07_678 [Ramlibacter sp.]|nr:hypothetical protein [Ramlibacter sp.]